MEEFRGEGIAKQNNESIVFDLLCQMKQPILTTNDMLRGITKKHRKIDLTYNQMRDVLNSLYGKGKITTIKEGNFSKISTVLPNSMMVFSQPLEHKKHTTPPYVWKWFKIITDECKNFSISMKDIARRIFFDPMNPSEYDEENAMRKIRNASTGYRRRKYVKKNGMPFNRYIISDLTSNNPGYRLPKDKQEVDDDLKKKKQRALTVWKEYWNMVEIASLDQQIRYVATENEQVINQAIKKEMRENNEI